MYIYAAFKLKTYKAYQSFIYSQTDALVSCLKKKQY